MREEITDPQRPICETDGCSNVAKKKSKKRKDGSIRYGKICASCERKKYGIPNRPKPMSQRNDGIKRRRYKVDRARMRDYHIELKEQKFVMQGYQCANKKCPLPHAMPIVCYDFHHTDPTIKENRVSHFNSKKKMREEADKCVLLCAVCHRLAHSESSLVEY